MELRKYIRNKRNQRVGVLISNEYNSVGWALCNTGKGDYFDREKGIMIARGRERKAHLDSIPSSICEEVAAMLDRSRRYFSPKK